MRLKLGLLLSCCTLSGCLTDTNGALMELQHALQPDTTCSVSISNPTVSYGQYDPTIDASGYHLFLLVRNDLEQRTDDPLDYGVVNVRNRINDVEITAFEGCWFQYNGDITRFGSVTDTQLVDCKTLPNQSGTLPANGEIDEGGETQTISTATVLTPTHLKQIFGGTFDATKIPAAGVVPPSASDLASDPASFDYHYSFSTQDPGIADRSVYWGENYPPTRQSLVVVQLRAVAHAQNGSQIYSNWFIFPIYVCPGCFQDDCLPLNWVACLTCADGSTCAAGKCGDGKTDCTSKNVFNGQVPNYTQSSLDSVCLVSQQVTGPSCLTQTGCPPPGVIGPPTAAPPQ